MTLTGASEPLTFPGAAATHAALLGDEVRDLNAMTRRGRYAHRLSRLMLRGPTELR